MSRFIDAYSVSTGRKQRIPEHWLSLFPGRFRPTPKQRSLDRNRGIPQGPQGHTTTPPSAGNPSRS